MGAPKKSPAPRPAAPKDAPTVTVDGHRFISDRKVLLREIEKAAGSVLLRGKDRESIEQIKRGRLGGRKDSLASLNSLLQRYRNFGG